MRSDHEGTGAHAPPPEAMAPPARVPLLPTDGTGGGGGLATKYEAAPGGDGGGGLATKYEAAPGGDGDGGGGGEARGGGDATEVTPGGDGGGEQSRLSQQMGLLVAFRPESGSGVTTVVLREYSTQLH